MIILGLTGSIGMGKSTAAGMLARMGCAVHDSDEAVNRLMLPSGAAFEHVAVSFPEAWDRKKRRIKKDVLAKSIFSDSEKKEELEEILHPLVRLAQANFIRKQKKLGKDIVVLDIPLLFETGADRRVDYSICVSAPFYTQRRRVLSRGMDEERFLKIFNAQMPDSKKRALADFTVPTGMGYAYTARILKEILNDVRAK